MADTGDYLQPDGVKWVVIGSRPTVEEALDFAKQYSSVAGTKKPRIFHSSNGQYAIVLGPLHVVKLSDVRIAIPNDSYLATGKNFDREVMLGRPNSKSLNDSRGTYNPTQAEVGSVDSIEVLSRDQPAPTLGASDSNCRIWEPVKNVRHASWNGACKDGRADGVGIATWKAESNGKIGIVTYEGGVTGGFAMGPGILSYSNGAKVEGNFREGRMNGKIKYTSPSGDSYVGEARDSKPDGTGVMISSLGNRYTGSFRDGKMEGYGVLTTAAGLRYEGTFRGGKFYGPGRLYFADGGRYEGDFVEGKFSGKGVQWFASGDRYEGQFREGRFEGTGVYIFANGSRYEGNFRRGKLAGYGVYRFANRSKYEGEFRNDRAHGRGTFYSADGEKFSGQWRDGCLLSTEYKLNVGATAEECSR